MQRLSGSNPRSQAPPQDEDRAGQAPRQPQPGRHRVLLLTMTDYARNHAQLPQVRGALAGDLSLRMGYFLIGGDRAAGGSLLGGASFGIGIPTDADAGNVVSIVELIRDYAVAPAIQYIADLVQKDSQHEASG